MLLDLSLTHQDASLLAELLDVWQRKRSRNLLRTVYYDTKQALKDFGISVPPQMRAIDPTLGWVRRGVHALTDRSVFEGFVSTSGEDDPFGLSGVLAENDFVTELPQAQISSAVHSCSFLTVSQGDVAAGEPAVLIIPRAADDSAAVWDNRRRALRGFLSVVETDAFQQPVSYVMYTPEKVVTLTKQATSWRVDARVNPLGVVSVAPLVLGPELKRPFGHSRITRTAMWLTDAAVRTVLRAEVSAEFYSAVEYWLFGPDVSQFAGSDKWSAVMGRIKALDVEDGEDKPTLHRFNGASPQPHTDQLRTWATLFAAEMGMSVASMGVISDNPSSAEAIFGAKEDLIVDVQQANRTWGRGAVRAAQLAVRLRDGEPSEAVAGELRTLTAAYTDPAIVSPTSAADAFVKRASVIPGFAETEVGLEAAGLSRDQIARYQAARRTQQATSLVSALRANADAAIAASPAVAAAASERGGIDPDAAKKQFDALGVAIRAGVDPQQAAGAVGLAGIEFTGAVPTSLRLPEKDAQVLEQ